MLHYSLITSAEALSDDDLVALRSLLLQLTSCVESLTRVRMTETLRVGYLLSVREEDLWVGLGYLMPQPLLTRLVGEIQTVVVDEKYRGRGIGSEIIQRLIAQARALGLTRLFLTSRPQRVEANRLYGRFGFKPHATNLYRLDL